ncbi:hypothetical protein LSH36_249g01011 [Paralvinella palmiformis]|uniref:Cerebellar degeneration-related protein 2-like n=1 Tax=Paralvinella palmiformis TaxID=53620 RepID=A0AAD9N4H2_9ANNE|nr:hypothetical protein LSH36_249g01011 [Paralvinella palmiformis]
MMYSAEEFTACAEQWSQHGEQFWYENDLQLAAELGKTLLERNKDLEAQLKYSQHVQLEQSREIDLLTKQLEVLRNVNDSRMRIYEEVDRNLQELEKTNKKFRKEIRADKERIKGLTSTVDTLEVKCAELSAKLEELKASEKKRRKHEQKRSWNSVPSLVESTDYKEIRSNFDYLGFPAIFQSLDRKSSPADSERLYQMKETLREVRLELAKEQRKREDAESQMTMLMKENKDLRTRVDRLEKDQEEMTTSEHELYPADLYARSTQIVCRTCHRGAASDTSSIADPELIEHDIDEIPRGEVVRLKCGGSAYGSRESLNLIGLEPDDVMYETGSDILVTGQVTLSPEEESLAGTKRSPDSNISLLGELEIQYRKLVRKYEKLIEAKSQRVGAVDAATQDNPDEPPLERREASNGVKLRPKSLATPNGEKRKSWRESLKDLDLRSPVDPIEGHFENGPPEYKRLFKEIFETLRRSAAYEDNLNSDECKSSFSSPDDVPMGLGDKSG